MEIVEKQREEEDESDGDRQGNSLNSLKCVTLPLSFTLSQLWL